MKITKRSVVLLAALSLGVLASSAASAAEPLKVWVLSGPSGDYFAGALKRFEAKTGTETKLSVYPNEQYKTAIQVGVRSADPPDVFQMWAYERANRLQREGVAAELGDFSKELSAASLSAYTFDGKLYGVPFSHHGKYLWYNTKYFQDNKLNLPTTFNGLLALCKQIRSIDANMVPIALGASEPWTIDHYIAMFNQKLVADDVRQADYTLKAPADKLFTDPGYVAALQKLLDMQAANCFNDGITALTPEAARSMFASGAAAMTYCGTWCMATFDSEGLKDGYKAIRMPNLDDQKQPQDAIHVIIDGLQVHTIVDKRGTRDAAIAFLNFVLTPEEQAMYAKVSGSPPAVPAAADLMKDASPMLLWAIRDIGSAKVVIAELDTSLEQTVSDKYLRGYQDVINKVKTPADVMKEVAAAAVAAQAERTKSK
jgi:raffinose/stachyose/melibiose transport system substrate-binding protein